MARHVGRYELLRELGRGGAGVVYEAVLRGPGGFQKRVAVKVLPEAESLAPRGPDRRAPPPPPPGGRLRGGPHGRRRCVLCHGAVRGGLAGPTSRRCPRARWSTWDCRSVRRSSTPTRPSAWCTWDLKPANLLIHRGQVKVADLGIAHAHGFALHPGVRGTPRYMAPEQARGLALDARADQYALGITLVELATRRTALPVETLDGTHRGLRAPQRAGLGGHGDDSRGAAGRDGSTGRRPVARRRGVREPA